MSERWKPGNGEHYYYFYDDGDVDSHVWRNDLTDRQLFERGNCFRTEAEALAAAEKVKALLLSLHCDETLQAKQLPKLTAEVFDRPDCPEWARYATVDVQGLAYWYQYFPIIDERIGVWKAWGNKRQLIDGFFDRSDWQNSRVERTKKETKLPDWCKVGEWVYVPETNAYHKITFVDESQVNTISYDTDCCSRWTHQVVIEETMQARLRPYNADEMKALVGKVIAEKYHGGLLLATAYNSGEDCDGKPAVALLNEWTDSDDLLNGGYTIDGKPAGVLEHLENGEWVK